MLYVCLCCCWHDVIVGVSKRKPEEDANVRSISHSEMHDGYELAGCALTTLGYCCCWRLRALPREPARTPAERRSRSPQASRTRRLDERDGFGIRRAPSWPHLSHWASHAASLSTLPLIVYSTTVTLGQLRTEACRRRCHVYRHCRYCRWHPTVIRPTSSSLRYSSCMPSLPQFSFVLIWTFNPYHCLYDVATLTEELAGNERVEFGGDQPSDLGD